MRIKLGLCLAAAVLPIFAALAQPGPDMRDQIKTVRQAEQDLKRAQIRGNRPAIRDAERRLQAAKQALGATVRDNRPSPTPGAWRAPFGYQKTRIGGQLRPEIYGRAYEIQDVRRHNLRPASRGQKWVRHYDDAILVNERNGRVVNVIHGFFR